MIAFPSQAYKSAPAENCVPYLGIIAFSFSFLSFTDMCCIVPLKVLCALDYVLIVNKTDGFVKKDKEKQQNGINKNYVIIRQH